MEPAQAINLPLFVACLVAYFAMGAIVSGIVSAINKQSGVTDDDIGFDIFIAAIWPLCFMAGVVLLLYKFGQLLVELAEQFL